MCNCSICNGKLQCIGMKVMKEFGLVKELQCMSCRNTTYIKKKEYTEPHHLKIATEYIDAVISGLKTFELRKNDRDFKVGDYLLLREYTDGEYTDKNILKQVTYILKGGQYGLDPEYVILGIK